MSYGGYDRDIVMPGDGDAPVPTQRIAAGYPAREAADTQTHAAPPARDLLTARHAAALYQTHVIAAAMAPANDDAARAERRIGNLVTHAAEPLPLVCQNGPILTLTQVVDDAQAERAFRRGIALTCLVAGAALFFWAGVMAARGPQKAVDDTWARPVHTVELPRMAEVPGAAPRPQVVVDATAVPVEQQLAVADRLVAEGNIIAARRMLLPLAQDNETRALFALAETFDPNMIAVWRAGVQADPYEARRLYQAAGAGGHLEAARRLDALP